ncbi:CRTAC1 family protein [Frigoriglobus tundricola]|uniref:CRTAC1 family protein n=1 Tax=Frigoriglobus tundricola TaxID=2774151 RepID=UPI00148ECDE4|nr:CRTAC1 family protein [Frigoriglobus tundricola]
MALAFLVLVPACATFGCRGAPAPSGDHGDGGADGPDWFEDASAALGLDFVHDPGASGTYYMPQSMGSGAAFIHEFHPDSTETLYLYLLHNAGPDSKSVNRLYRRLPDGTFRDVTRGSGLDVAGFNMGVAVGDVNNDGLPDVVLTQVHGVRLFLNRGAGRFEDVTKGSGLSNTQWGTSACFFDYDRDGWLDLVVVNYLDYDAGKDCLNFKSEKDFCGPAAFPGTCSKLFHNRGADHASGARFEDVTFASGLGQVPGPGLGVACADFDGDGWPDVFVANDGVANRLWINRRNGTFADEAVSRGVAYSATGAAYANMGIAIGDVTNDGMLDLYVTHLMREMNTLWKQGPRGRFRDRTVEFGLTDARWRGTGFGTLMADFDLDGGLDIAVVNGRIMRGGTATGTDLGFWEPYAERNQLFANDGRGHFRDASPSNKAFSGPWNVARGLAVADINDDGAPDLIVTTIGTRARLFRNVAPNRGHWLKVRAFDPERKRDAYGATVRVRAAGTDRLRLINPGHSYLSSSSPLGLFGLGTADRYESITVTWPDGRPPEVFPGGAADRTVVLRKGEGRRP